EQGHHHESHRVRAHVFMHAVNLFAQLVARASQQFAAQGRTPHASGTHTALMQEEACNDDPRKDCEHHQNEDKELIKNAEHGEGDLHIA
ncbi:hypothetical protein RZS08_54745, partial [Arthrospira platensis SPKY1]|nr:hypothetical protein [Arthrospira platensis SPKY1]